MSLICVLNVEDSLNKEPYASFAKKFNAIKDKLHEKTIVIPAGSGKADSFENGFYTNDERYGENLQLKFFFSKLVMQKGLCMEQDAVFIRMVYSFAFDEGMCLEHHLSSVRSLRKRVPFFYIPKARGLAFSYRIDEGCELIFDAIGSEEDVLEICFSLLNQIIAIYSFDE